MNLCDRNIVSFFGQIEQGAHYLLAFLEKAVVELVYKFDEKSYRKFLKRCVDR